MVYFVFWTPLAICTFLFDNKLLSGVCIDRIDLRELLLLNLGLLLFVLFESFFALVACKLGVWGALWHRLCCGSTRTFGVYCVSFQSTNVLSIWIYASKVWIDLAIDRIFILAALICTTDADLTAIILVMGIHLACGSLSDHVHMGTTVWVVFLSVISCELVLVLEEGVLMPLRTSRSIRNIAGHVTTLRTTTTFSWRINFVKLGTPLVHMRSAWILASMSHWVRKGIFASNVAAPLFTSSCTLYRL